VRGSSANTEEYLKKAEEVVKNDPTALVAVHDVEMINRVTARTLNSRILKEEELENIINIGLSVFDGDCITVNITDHETDVIDTVFDALDKDKHAMALAHAYNKYSDKADECECESDMSEDRAEAFSVERLKKQFANLLDSCPNDQKLDFLNRFIEDSGADEKYKVFDTSTFHVIANPSPDLWPPIMDGKSYADDDTDPLAPAIESVEEPSNESYTDSAPINSMADILKNIDMDAFPPMNAVSFEGEEPSEEKQKNKYEDYSNDPMPEKDPLLESIAMARRNRLGE
ncbi:MAG: hypothetical protein IKA36_04065, partial [Clostridia bacterium]|nr:hypothetical protein [Clostridia bacterium]